MLFRFSWIWVDALSRAGLPERRRRLLAPGFSRLRAASRLTARCLLPGQAGWGAPMCGQLRVGHSLVGVFLAGGDGGCPWDLLIALWQSTAGRDHTHWWPPAHSIIQEASLFVLMGRNRKPSGWRSWSLGKQLTANISTVNIGSFIYGPNSAVQSG